MSLDNLKIIFVPGKNPKPEPDLHKAQLWRCLVHGIEQVDHNLAYELSAHPEIFELASWNYLYYNQYKSLDRDLPWIEHLLTRGPATRQEQEKIHSVRVRLGRLIYHLADWFPFLIRFAPDPAVKAAVQETLRYFHNSDNIACEIRKVLKDLVKEAWSNHQKILLIGHSMGSIISYDTLWELSREEGYQGKIDLFLTIGSPLGMRYVQHRLIDANAPDKIRYPSNIRQWINISSMGDLTALDPYLAGDYEDMVNGNLVESIRDEHRDVYNYFVDARGLNAHRSYGYLVNAKVGKTIADWLQAA